MDGDARAGERQDSKHDGDHSPQREPTPGAILELCSHVDLLLAPVWWQASSPSRTRFRVNAHSVPIVENACRKRVKSALRSRMHGTPASGGRVSPQPSDSLAQRIAAQ